MAGPRKAVKGSGKYLVRVKDGVVFNWTKELAALSGFRMVRSDTTPDEKQTRAQAEAEAEAEEEAERQERGEPAFDIGKASKKQLLAFAKDEYGLDLDPKTDEKLVRKLVSDAAKKAAAAAAE